MQSYLFKDLPIGTQFKTDKASPVFTKQSEDLTFQQNGREVKLFDHSMVFVAEPPAQS